MKQALLAALLLVGLGSAVLGYHAVHAISPHIADPYDWRYTLADENGDLYTYDANAIPLDHSRLIQTANPNTKTPEWVGINGVLRWDGMNLSVGQLPESQIDNLLTDLAGKSAINHQHEAWQIVGNIEFIDARIARLSMAYGTTTRSLNTAFQPATSSPEFVSYTVDISSTLSLISGETGTVVLEYADDPEFTTNVVVVQSAVNGNTGTLAIGLNLTQITTASLTGMIPSGKYVRLRTINTVGSPVFTYRGQQEVKLPFR